MLKQNPEQVFKLHQLLDWAYSKLLLAGELSVDDDKLLDGLCATLKERPLTAINRARSHYELMKKPTLFPQSELIGAYGSSDLAKALTGFKWVEDNRSYAAKLELVTRIILKETNGAS